MSNPIDAPAGDMSPEHSKPTGGEVPAAPPVPRSVEEMEQSIENMDDEALNRILFAQPGQPAKQDGTDDGEEEEIETPPVIPPGSHAEHAATPPGDNPALDKPGADKSPRRLYFPKEVPAEERQKLIEYTKALADGEVPGEAAMRIFGTAAAPISQEQSSTPATPPASEAPPVLPPVLAEIDQRIADLNQRIEQAEADFDGIEAAKLTRQLTDAKLERQQAVFDAERAAVQTASYDQKFETNCETLRQEFPDLNDPNSALSVRLEELRDLADIRNPGHDADPDFIVSLARQAAADVSAKPAPAPAARPTPPAVKHRPVGAVPSGGAPVARGIASASPETFERMVSGMSDEEQAAFLAQVVPMPH